jgi:hypothetical protein
MSIKNETEWEIRERQVKELYSKGPVLRGGIYCSPWCGANCTKAAYDLAVSKAKALARRMGKGWKPRVHENMGWFYGVYKGNPQGSFGMGVLEITPPDRPGDTYTAWIQTTPQFIVHHKDPKIALKEAIAEFDKHIANLHRLRALVDPLL